MEAARDLQAYLSGIRRDHDRKERRKAILRYVSQLSHDLPDLAGKARVAHQTGPGNKPCRPSDGSYAGFEYVREQLPDVYAAADIIIGRAGAGTIWESVAAGKPMVLVPLSGNGSRGDQVENARLLAESGAALCLNGEDATPSKVLSSLLPLIASAEARKKIADAASHTAKPNAASSIADMLLERIRKEERI